MSEIGISERVMGEGGGLGCVASCQRSQSQRMARETMPPRAHQSGGVVLVGFGDEDVIEGRRDMGDGRLTVHAVSRCGEGFVVGETVVEHAARLVAELEPAGLA